MNAKLLATIVMLSLFLFSGISAYAVEDTVSEYISGYDYQLDHYPLTNDPSSITITANCESGFEIDRELSECNSNYLLRFGSLRTNIDSYSESISCTYSIDLPWACGNGLEVNCPWIEATALCFKEDTPEPECYNDYDCESGYDCINDECVYQEPEPECYNDYDCASGEECNNAGDCVPEPIVIYDDVRIYGVPDSGLIEENYNYATVIANLYDYTTYDSALTVNFSIDSQDNSGLINCYIDNGNFVECSPPTDNRTGENRIVVRATDSEGQTDTDVFYVRVEEEDEPEPINHDPTISGLPNVPLNENDGYQNNVIYLPSFANDVDNDSLSFSINNQTNDSLIYCVIDSQDYIDCGEPVYNQFGASTVTVRVNDGRGGQDTASFTVYVNEEYSPPDEDYPRPYFKSSFENETFEIEENYNNSTTLAYLKNEVDYSGDKDDLTFTIENQNNDSLIYCLIDSSERLYCNAPRDDRVGYNDLEISVKNPDNEYDYANVKVRVYSETTYTRCSDIDFISRTKYIDESDTEVFTFDIKNNGDEDFDVSDVYVSESSSYISIEDTDFDSIIQDNSTGDLSVKIKSNSISSDKSVSVGVQIKGRFDNGDYCSFSEIDDDFELKIKDEYNSYDSSCNDVKVVRETLEMDESDTDTLYFTIENNGDSDFEVEDLDVKESSTYLTILDFDEEGEIRDNNEKRFAVKIKSNSVSSDKTVTLEVDFKGRFDDGEYCSFSEIGYEYFKVKIDNAGHYSNSDSHCEDIELSVSDTTVPENSSKTKVVTIRNTGDRSFTVYSVKEKETNPYFDVSIRSKPTMVYSDSSKEISLKIETKNVSSTKTGEVELSVSGRFSDGYYCSTSSIKKDFDVKVTNSSYYDDEDDEENEEDNEDQEELSGNVEFSFNESFITLKENERKTIITTIKNAMDRRDCFVVTAKDSVFVDADVSGTEFCLNSGESKNATISLVGKEQGSANIQVKVTYDNKSKSKFVTVDVLKKETQLSAEVVEANSEIITLENTADTVRNVVIRLVNSPEGVTIQEIVLDEWVTGEIIELPIEFEEGFEGAVESIIRVSSDEGNLSVPVKFIVEKEEPITSGLVGLATTAGLAIGLLILVILAVIGILAVFSKN